MLAGGMEDADRQHILWELTRGRAALAEALAGVEEQLAGRKPGPDRWSILECIEHLATAERFLLSQMRGASRSDRPHADPAREARILERGADRTRRMRSPEVGLPRGRYQTLAEALAAFDEARGETIPWVEAMNDDPRCWLTTHPLIPGPVNCSEILAVISIHPARHAAQIVEIRESLARGEIRQGSQ